MLSSQACVLAAACVVLTGDLFRSSFLPEFPLALWPLLWKVSLQQLLPELAGACLCSGWSAPLKTSVAPDSCPSYIVATLLCNALYFFLFPTRLWHSQGQGLDLILCFTSILPETEEHRVLENMCQVNKWNIASWPFLHSSHATSDPSGLSLSWWCFVVAQFVLLYHIL